MSRWNALTTTTQHPRDPLARRGAFANHARQAIQDNPDYFVWWYTVKSLLLVAAIGVASFFAGKSSRS